MPKGRDSSKENSRTSSNRERKDNAVRQSSFPSKSLEIATEEELYRQEQKKQAQIPERKMWNNDFNLIMACMSIVLGMGNAWRFPKAVYENGGGSFMLAYTALTVVVGYPFLYLELLLGQYTRVGPSAITRCVPLAKGVEIGIGIVSFTTAVSFNVVLAQSVLHLYLTFVDLNLMPLSGCYGFWEKEIEACYKTEQKLCTEKQHVLPVTEQVSRGKLAPDPSDNSLYVHLHRYEGAAPDCVNVTESVNEHFFHISVGMDNHNVGGIEELQPELATCLVLSWGLLFTVLTTGISATRKMTFVVTLVPLGLISFLVVGTLWEDSAAYGLLYLFVPRQERLLDITMWANALTQLFSSLGLAHGPIFVYGSFNRFNADIHRAVFLVAAMNLSASIMYSTIIFSSLGRLALSLDIPTENVVHGGQNVMFVAMNKYSVHWIFSSTFFLLVVIAGTNSQVSIIEAAMIHLGDTFPAIYYYTRPFSLIYCIVGCLLGMPFVTRGGIYLLHMIDSQVIGFLLPYVAFFELFCVIWIYGLDHLKLDVLLMHGELSTMKLEYAWRVFIPVILAGSVVTHLLTGCSSLRFGPIEYPIYSCYIGWSLIIFGALQVPLWAVGTALSHHKKLNQCLLPASYQDLNQESESCSDLPGHEYHH